MQALYHQYQKAPNGHSSFRDYLWAAGVHTPWGGSYLVKYVRSETFPFSDGIPMTAKQFANGSHRLKDGEEYNIDVGTGSDVKQDYYHVHDRILGRYFYLNTGESGEERITARALYGFLVMPVCSIRGVRCFRVNQNRRSP